MTPLKELSLTDIVQLFESALLGFGHKAEDEEESQNIQSSVQYSEVSILDENDYSLIGLRIESKCSHKSHCLQHTWKRNGQNR